MATVQFAEQRQQHRTAGSPMNNSPLRSHNASSGGILTEMESIKGHARLQGLPAEVTLGVNSSER